MAICTIHGEVITHPLGCTRCQWVESKRKKDGKKSFTKNGFTVSNKSNLSKLKEAAQRLINKRMKELYCKDKVFVNCSTCKKPVRVKGSSVVDTVHCGHYHPKGIYWELAYLPENSLPQCYDCNVNNQGIIPAMRNELVKIYGEQKIKELDAKADQFMLEKKAGIKKNQPSEIWLMGVIQDLKNKTCA